MLRHQSGFAADVSAITLSRTYLKDLNEIGEIFACLEYLPGVLVRLEVLLEKGLCRDPRKQLGDAVYITDVS